MFYVPLVWHGRALADPFRRGLPYVAAKRYDVINIDGGMSAWKGEIE